eukprot:c19342_g1_i1.p1 GENE.c19342_g1_i1~~c19342_g1_i1.p1  ORF type:complete len:335 (+),score=47.32 c19342_g1_i1:1-1005(+)
MGSASQGLMLVVLLVSALATEWPYSEEMAAVSLEKGQELTNYELAALHDPFHPAHHQSVSQGILKNCESQTCGTQKIFRAVLFAQLALILSPMSDDHIEQLEQATRKAMDVVMAGQDTPRWADGRFIRLLEPFSGNALLFAAPWLRATGVKIAKTGYPLRALPFLVAGIAHEKLNVDCAGDTAMGVMCMFEGGCEVPSKQLASQIIRDSRTQRRLLVYGLKMLSWAEETQKARKERRLNWRGHQQTLFDALNKLYPNMSSSVEATTGPPAYPVTNLWNILLPRCMTTEDQSSAWCKWLVAVRLSCHARLLSVGKMQTGALIYAMSAAQMAPTEP